MFPDYLSISTDYVFNNYLDDITKTLKLKKYANFDGQPLSNITEEMSHLQKGHIYRRNP